MYYDDEAYEIEKIKEKKVVNGKILYKVRWTGFQREDDSWLQEELINPDLVRAYEVSTAHFEDAQRQIATEKPLFVPIKICDFIKVEGQPHFLVDLVTGRGYVPADAMRKYYPKMTRNFLIDYYAKLKQFGSLQRQ